MYRLSIITINRNNAEGLRKTLASVAAQTYREIEHIIIDGASTDDSVDVIREYESANLSSSHPLTIIWLSEPDNGVYHAMNKGIRKAQGEYLLFLNSGDFLIANDVITKVFDVCNGADILCAQCNVSRNGNKECTIALPQTITFGRIYLHGLPHQSIFIKRTLFDEYGLYREDFKYNSDIAFWYKSIIDNNASTQTINVVTTDYNLEGISSRECNSEQYIREKAEILRPYSRFTPDYDKWRREKEILNKYLWIERHKYLQRCLTLFYKMLKHVNRL